MQYLTFAVLAFAGRALAAPQVTDAPQDSTATVTGLSIHNSFTSIALSDLSNSGTVTSASDTTATEDPTSSISAPAGTSIAVFTILNGGVYTASLVSSAARVAGYSNLAPGASVLVGGQEVEFATEGVVAVGQTVPYSAVTGSSTVVVTTTSSSSGRSGVATVTASNTVPVAASTGASAASGSATSAGAAATVRPKSQVAALGGIAGLLCLLG